LLLWIVIGVLYSKGVSPIGDSTDNPPESLELVRHIARISFLSGIAGIGAFAFIVAMIFVVAIALCVIGGIVFAAFSIMV